MQQRFSYTGSSKKQLPHIPYALLYVMVWIIIISLFVFGIRSFGGYTREKQLESLEHALQRGIANCYALEGIYPPDIAYLQEHYGLHYDEEQFFVDYRSLASNLYPFVTVIERR